MSVRGEIIDIYESCPVAVLIFRFRQSAAFLKSRIRWEREYLPTSPLGQFPNNTAITITTTTSWDSRGTLVLEVPSIRQSINPSNNILDIKTTQHLSRQIPQK